LGRQQNIFDIFTITFSVLLAISNKQLPVKTPLIADCLLVLDHCLLIIVH